MHRIPILQSHATETCESDLFPRSQRIKSGSWLFLSIAFARVCYRVNVAYDGAGMELCSIDIIERCSAGARGIASG